MPVANEGLLFFVRVGREVSLTKNVYGTSSWLVMSNRILGRKVNPKHTPWKIKMELKNWRFGSDVVASNWVTCRFQP